MSNSTLGLILLEQEFSFKFEYFKETLRPQEHDNIQTVTSIFLCKLAKSFKINEWCI